MSGFALTAGSGGGGGNREKCPAGAKVAVVAAIIDLGTQHSEFQNEAKWVRQVYVVWELPTTKTTGGASHLIASKATLSLNEKATLRKWAEAITGNKIADGAQFDVSALLGMPCIVNVQHAGAKGYPKVAGVSGLPDGMPEVKGTHAPFACTLEEFKKGKVVPEWVPWAWCDSLSAMAAIPAHIKASKEIAGEGGPTLAGVSGGTDAADKGDPIPF